MKKFIVLFLLSFCFSFIFAENIIVQSITGTVQVKLTSDSNWMDCKVSQTLNSGSIINTGFKSNAIIKVNNSLLEVKQLTQVSVSSLIDSKENVTTDVYLKYGKVKAVVEPKPGEIKTNFKVRSANSTASVRGTQFNYSDSFLNVERGTVLLENINGDFALIQEDETANIEKFRNIQEAIVNKYLNYSINSSPLGLSSTEVESDASAVDKKFNGKKASVIVRIKITDKR